MEELRSRQPTGRLRSVWTVFGHMGAELSSRILSMGRVTRTWSAKSRWTYSNIYQATISAIAHRSRGSTMTTELLIRTYASRLDHLREMFPTVACLATTLEVLIRPLGICRWWT